MPGEKTIRISLGLYTAVVIAFFIYLPIAVIYVYSFNDIPFFIPEWRGFTLKWFIQGFSRKDVISSLINSLYVASLTTSISMALAIPSAFYVVRGRGKIKDAYMLYLIIPFIIPWIIIGISLYIFYWFAGIQKSLHTAILAHITYTIPLIITLVAPRLYSMNPDLENASMDLGATPIQTFRYVVFPQLYPAIVSAAIVAFVWSFDNFIISYYTLGAESTWPVWVFSVREIGRIFPVVMAVSSVIVTVSMIIITIIVRKGYVEIV